MEGVLILESEKVAIGYTYNLGWPFVMAVLFTLALVLLPILFPRMLVNDSEDSPSKMIVCIHMVCCFMWGLLVFAITAEETKKPSEYESRYKVVRQGNASIIEFYKRYEVLDQDGEIFTVREINADEE